MSATSPTFRQPGDTDDVLGRARSSLTRPSPSLLWKLVHTKHSVALTIGRLGLGLVMLPHGLQKVAGWFGGHGFSGTYGFFTEQLHVPGPFALLAIVTELVASIALVVGAFTRLAAAGIIGVMLGAIVLVHLPHGFFMNWAGNQTGEGFEYHLLAIALGLVLLVAGGGRASVDEALMRRRPMHGGGVDDALVDG